MKKIMLIAALALMTTNATAGGGNFHRRVCSMIAMLFLQLPEELNYFLKGALI